MSEKYNMILEIAEETGRVPVRSIDDGDFKAVIALLENAGFDVELSPDTDYLLC